MWAVVDAALGRILVAKGALGIPEQPQEQAEPLDTTPTEVFNALLQVSRQLSVLLEEELAPRHVYIEVTRASHLSARLLSSFPGAVRFPPDEALARGKRPLDVYERLAGCLEATAALARSAGVEVLTLELEPGRMDITSADVYDLAKLLVAELTYLHSLVPGLAPPVDALDPGRLYPSRVYQRVGLVEAQLAELTRLTRGRADWITR